MLSKENVKDLVGKTLKRYDSELVNPTINSKISAHNTVASTTANGHMTKEMVAKLNGIASGAEVNQNAISNIKVGTTTLAANAKQATLELAAGTNITLTPDATTGKVTITGKTFTKSDIGLGNVTNESKATMFTNAALTGTPTAPTATKGTNTTQIATTAFVAAGLADKANNGHTHSTADITSLTSYAKASSVGTLSTTDSLNVALGKLEKNIEAKMDIHTHPYRSNTWVPAWSDITSKPDVATNAQAQAKADAALASAKTYADNKISALVNGAPEALDTLQELATAIEGNQAGVSDLLTAVGTKAEKSYVDTELSKKANSSHTHTGAQVNLSGYSKASSVSALSTSDTVNVALGKLEKALDGKQAAGSYASSSHNHDDKYRPISYVPTWSEITSKPSTFTPDSHNQASNTINAMTGYSKPSSTSAISTSDSLNTAIGKLEKALDGKANSSHTHAYRPDTWVPTFAQVTSKPTTLSGYGITDAATSSSVSSLTTRVATIEGRLDKPVNNSDIDDIINFIKA